MLMALLNDETGAIVSIEIILILTVSVLSLIVGLSEVAVAVNTELNDISNAVGALNQDYAFTGFHHTSGWKPIANYMGTAFNDKADDCDTDLSCDLVCGTAGLSQWNEK